MRVDPRVPPAVVKQIFGQDGIRPENMSEELRDLLNPSISARPLHLPESGRIKTVHNKEFIYYLAFDRNGTDARHDRVEQLRSAGFDYATTKDVEMYSKADVRNPNEIRSGDRRLMKIPKARWSEIRKSQVLAALDMIHPRPSSNPQAMGNASMTPGINTEFVGADHEMRTGAVMSDAAKDLLAAERGERQHGNASVAKVRAGSKVPGVGESGEGQQAP